MYYILDCEEPLSEDDEAPLMDIRNCFRIKGVWSWKSGQPLERDKIPNPIEIEFKPLHGYKGPPVELLDVGVPIMTERLAQALVASGVDNIEFFDVVLKNVSTGATYPYKAYNIVGLVAATDLEKSQWESYDGNPVADVSFDTLVLDDAKAKGFLLFRLAENVNAIVVHESVQKQICSRGIDTLTFINPEDWVQL